jgi:hypothetical protein
VSDVFARIRAAAAQVAARARHVRIDDPALEALCARIAAEPPDGADADPAHHAFPEPSHTLAYVVTLDAVNFGSGWFPWLRKPDGRSGYYTIARALRARFEAHGPWDGAALRRISADDCARCFGQPLEGPAGELMALFAQALRELGVFLEVRCSGRFEGLVDAAGGRADSLVALLAEMPLYRDVARYGELEVPFYKRAQITVSDLATAFAGAGPGRFEDRERLTIFADNLVPHVLRREGVLVYAPELAAHIDAEREIPAGSAQEVEIRALALHAVERCALRLRERGVPLRAEQLDHWLWHRGQSAAMKATPRHRTRTPFY